MGALSMIQGALLLKMSISRCKQENWGTKKPEFSSKPSFFFGIRETM